jgi:hypothetical protein
MEIKYLDQGSMMLKDLILEIVLAKRRAWLHLAVMLVGICQVRNNREPINQDLALTIPMKISLNLRILLLISQNYQESYMSKENTVLGQVHMITINKNR